VTPRQILQSTTFKKIPFSYCPISALCTHTLQNKNEHIFKIHSLSPTPPQQQPLDSRFRFFFYLTAFSTCTKFQFWNCFFPSRDLGLFHIKFNSSQTGLFFLLLIIHPFIVSIELSESCVMNFESDIYALWVFNF